MQRVPPRYRRATPLELEDLGDDEAWLKEHARKPRPKRRRATQSASDEPSMFDVSRWRLPTRWRNDKRVGDSAIAKMMRGCDPARFEELTA
jgi:hypothetical protein